LIIGNIYDIYIKMTSVNEDFDDSIHLTRFIYAIRDFNGGNKLVNRNDKN